MHARQVISNATGMVEVVASSDEAAQRARQQVQLLVEEPEAGRVYRQACSPHVVLNQHSSLYWRPSSSSTIARRTD